jgi:hypothetical protein
MFPGRAIPHTTALVVTPWMRGAFDRLLTILTPGVIIRRDIRKLAANCWHLDCPFQSQFSVQEKKETIQGSELVVLESVQISFVL